MVVTNDLWFQLVSSWNATYTVKRLFMLNGDILHIDLDVPTSIAVDPQLGKMFWTDAGESPSIETAWLDGSKRRRLLGDRMRHPSGLTIDYGMDHTLYWVDAKMNTIESIRPDGTNRILVLKGTYESSSLLR